MNNDPGELNNSTQTTTTTSSSISNTIQLEVGQRFFIQPLGLNFRCMVEIQNTIPLNKFASAYRHLTRPHSLPPEQRDIGLSPNEFWNQNIIELKVLKEETINMLKANDTYTQAAKKAIDSLPPILHFPKSSWSLLGARGLPQGGGKKTRKNKNKTQKRR